MTTSDDLIWIVTLPTTLRLSRCRAPGAPEQPFGYPLGTSPEPEFYSSGIGTVKRALRSRGWSWRRPIVPRSCLGSIVGAGAFHDRVRDGNGWGHPALVTRTRPWTAALEDAEERAAILSAGRRA